MPNTVILTGWKEGIAKLNGMANQISKELDMEVGAAAEKWEGLARNSAPVDQNFLRQNISAKEVGLMHWEVVSAAEYSAYMEWGTRLKVKVPAELQAYALQFKGKPQEGNAKRLIYEWCRRQGIDPSAWWIVFHTIMVYGVNPHPFFFIHKPLIESQLKQRGDKVMKTEH